MGMFHKWSGRKDPCQSLCLASLGIRASLDLEGFRLIHLKTPCTQLSALVAWSLGHMWRDLGKPRAYNVVYPEQVQRYADHSEVHDLRARCFQWQTSTIHLAVFYAQNNMEWMLGLDQTQRRQFSCTISARAPLGNSSKSSKERIRSVPLVLPYPRLWPSQPSKT